MAFDRGNVDLIIQSAQQSGTLRDLQSGNRESVLQRDNGILRGIGSRLTDDDWEEAQRTAAGGR